MDYGYLNDTTFPVRRANSGNPVAGSSTRVSADRPVQPTRDDAAYWSIATTMKAGSLPLTSTEDAQATSAAVADSAAIGMQAAEAIVGQIQSRLMLAKAPGADRGEIGAQVDQLKQQLAGVVEASGFQGQNWLKTGQGQSPKMESLVGSVTKSASGDVEINVVNFDRAKSNLIAQGDASDGLLTRAYSGITRAGTAYDYYLLDAKSAVSDGSAREIGISASTTPDAIDGMLSAIGSMRRGMAAGAADINATAARITSTTDFLQQLPDNPGSSLAAAGTMDEQSVRRASELVQDQLRTSGLNIANASMANAMNLFA